MAKHKPDDLGLRRALAGGMVPVLVAAMAFLAALSLAGAMQADAVAQHWQEGAARAVTVQVPDPDQPLPATRDGPEMTRMEAVLRALDRKSTISSLRVLSGPELINLLRPWLGANAETSGLKLPGVIELRLVSADVDLSVIAKAVAKVAPGSTAEGHEAWVSRLLLIARSLEACAYAVVLVVALVAVAVVMVATQAGLASRREAIEIIHGLGAADFYIAGRFARRMAAGAALGGFLGALAALPVLIGMAILLAPLLGNQPPILPESLRDVSPLWLAIPVLPLASWLIGYLTAQRIVRRWLKSLP
jgi:cell division transport system permease protein